MTHRNDVLPRKKLTACREDKMRGVCDTCESVSELFQLSGRSDLNCSECHVCIRTTMLLYQVLKDIERAGGDAREVERQLKNLLNTLLGRVRHTVAQSALTPAFSH
jgi:hypothetical protein